MCDIDYCSKCILGKFGAVPEMKAAVETVRLMPGQVLYRAGDVPEYVYCVRRGVVGDFRAEMGEAEFVDIAFAGEAVGLKGIGAEFYGTDAIAQEDSELCAIPVAQIQRHVAKSPPLNGCMIRALSSQLGWLQSLIRVRLQRTGDSGLALLLTLLASRVSTDATAAGAICLTLPRRMLAQYMGVSLSTVTRQLNGLARRELVSVNRSRICLLDRAGLAKVARPFGEAAGSGA